MDRKKIAQSLVFLTVGIALVWFVYRDTNWNTLQADLHKFNYWWIALSVILNLLSQWIRAIRWKILFTPTRYKPRVGSLFFAVLILAFTNQIIPRGGEVARLGVIKKYEKIPISTQLGIALAERLTDFMLLMLLFVSLVLWQHNQLAEVLNNNNINLHNLGNRWYVWVLIVIAIVLGSILLIKYNNKIKRFAFNIWDGFKTITRIKNTALYTFLSILIYALWFMMLYVIFFSFPATSQLNMKAAALTFGLSTMAFLLPIQSGMGAWHFIVVQCLLYFGIAESSGKSFSLIAHASTNLVYIPFGVLALLILPLLTKKE